MTRSPWADAEAATDTKRSRGNRRRRWRIGGLIVALILLIAAGYVGYAYVEQQAAEAPYRQAASFCDALQTRHYAAAYSSLSSELQQQQSEAQFTEIAQLHDAVDGAITRCTVTHKALQRHLGMLTVVPQVATAQVTLQRTGRYTGAVELAQEHGSWRITQIGTGVEGSDVRPILVARDYCQALSSGNYTQAYEALSPLYQQAVGSSSAYADALSALFGSSDVRLQACTPDVRSLHVDGPASQAVLSVDVQLRVMLNGSSALRAHSLTLTLVPNGNSWKIESQTEQPPEQS